jgi:2'-5' RNA ligase
MIFLGMRLFVSVPIPEPLAESLGRERRRWEARFPAVRWAKPDTYHFTLKFLGEVPEDRRAEIERTLNAAAQVPAFPAELRGLGAFPPEKSPRVLWVGLGEGRQAMAQLAARVESALSRAGFPPEEKPYHPHLTVGRFKPGARAIPPQAEEPYGRFRADRLRLMKSELKPEGAVHSVLSEFMLKPA